MRALALLAGIVLLLPGACSLGFILLLATNSFGTYGDGVFLPMIPVWLVCFAVSFGGFVMIRRSLRAMDPDRDKPPPPG